MLLSYSALKQLLREGLTDEFYLPVLGINWLKDLISSEFFLIESYLQGALRIAPFVERFKITALGRSC